jgi:hypothetical protein
MTCNNTAGRQEQGNSETLAARAEWSEQYAIATMRLAAALVREAERAVIHAIAVRKQADSTPLPVRPRSIQILQQRLALMETLSRNATRH